MTCSQFQARDKRDRQPSSVTFLTFTLICTFGSCEVHRNFFGFPIHGLQFAFISEVDPFPETLSFITKWRFVDLISIGAVVQRPWFVVAGLQTGHAAWSKRKQLPGCIARRPERDLERCVHEPR